MIGMDKLWEFMASMVKQLDVDELTRVLKTDVPGSSLPQQLSGPRRVRPKLQSMAVAAADGRSSDEHFWRLLCAARQDEEDVAYLPDIDMESPILLPLEAYETYTHMYA
jgi:hypothetical protein